MAFIGIFLSISYQSNVAFLRLSLKDFSFQADFHFIFFMKPQLIFLKYFLQDHPKRGVFYEYFSYDKHTSNCVFFKTIFQQPKLDLKEYF